MSQPQVFQVASKSLGDARDVLASIDQRLASLGERLKAVSSQMEESKGREGRLHSELEGMRKPDAEALQMAIDRHAMAQRKAGEARQRAVETQQLKANTRTTS